MSYTSVNLKKVFLYNKQSTFLLSKIPSNNLNSNYANAVTIPINFCYPKLHFSPLMSLLNKVPRVPKCPLSARMPKCPSALGVPLE